MALIICRTKWTILKIGSHVETKIILGEFEETFSLQKLQQQGFLEMITVGTAIQVHAWVHFYAGGENDIIYS